MHYLRTENEMQGWISRF